MLQIMRTCFSFFVKTPCRQPQESPLRPLPLFGIYEPFCPIRENYIRCFSYDKSIINTDLDYCIITVAQFLPSHIQNNLMISCKWLRKTLYRDICYVVHLKYFIILKIYIYHFRFILTKVHWTSANKCVLQAGPYVKKCAHKNGLCWNWDIFDNYIGLYVVNLISQILK